MSSEFDPYSEWLGVASEERPPDYYSMLGVDPGDSSTDRIQTAFADAVARVRIYQVGARGTEAQRVLDELSTAFRVLSTPQSRREYDAQLASGDPWQQVVSLLKGYVNGDAGALEEAEHIASQASPEEGALHLARCALEQGIIEPQFLEELDAHAARRRMLACHACYAFIDRPPNPTPTPVVLTPTKLSSPALAIEMKNRLLAREATVSSSELLRDRTQPAASLDRRGAVLLVVFGVALLALSLGFAMRPDASALLLLLGASTLVMAVAGAATWFLYRPRVDSAHDVAWIDVVPALLSQSPSAAVTSFVVGLVKASAGTGNRYVRRQPLDAAIKTHVDWASNGVVARDAVYALHRMALLDALKSADRERFRLLAFRTLLEQCFQGDYALDALDHVTSNGKLLHLLSAPGAASARLSVLRLCRESRLSASDIFRIVDRSSTLRTLFERDPVLNDKVVLTLLALVNFQQWRESDVPAQSAFDLAAAGQFARFEKWPDLILDAGHRDIVLCGRGVHFEDLFLTDRPTIHRATGTADMTIVINGRFRRPNVPPATVARLNAFCEFCFGTLATKVARLVDQDESPDLDARFFQAYLRCPRCGERTPA